MSEVMQREHLFDLEGVDEAWESGYQAGYAAARPHIITTVEELEALPGGSLLIASGRFATINGWDSPVKTRPQETGSFTSCTIRRVPREWAEGRAVFELLTSGASRNNGGFEVTTPALLDLKLPVTVLHEPGAEAAA